MHINNITDQHSHRGIQHIKYVLHPHAVHKYYSQMPENEDNKVIIIYLASVTTTSCSNHKRAPDCVDK